MAAEIEEQEYDDFGLPIKKIVPPPPPPEADSPRGQKQLQDADNASPTANSKRKWSLSLRRRQSTTSSPGSRSSSINSQMPKQNENNDSGSEQSFKDASSIPSAKTPSIRERPDDEGPSTPALSNIVTDIKDGAVDPSEKTPRPPVLAPPSSSEKAGETDKKNTTPPAPAGTDKNDNVERIQLTDVKDKPLPATAPTPAPTTAMGHNRDLSVASTVTDPGQLSEFSHQALTTKKQEEGQDGDGGWQTMPSFAAYDMYDDDDRLVAKEFKEEDDDQTYGYGGLGGAGKGYTRVLVDDDADSVTSMDDNTQYLFSKAQGTSLTEEEEARDAVSQMEATKDLLTEGQRIAYVGIARLEIFGMVKEFEEMQQTRKSKKEIQFAAEAMKMWAQKMMIRLYAHMEVSAEEQVMIEQLTNHGVRPDDLTPALMANSRVKNPMAEEEQEKEADSVEQKSSASTPLPKSPNSPRKSTDTAPSPPESSDLPTDSNAAKRDDNIDGDDEECAAPPLPYEAHTVDEMADVQTPNQMTKSAQIDIDLRWTVLCDLFLVLIADSVYDARSRCLLERVGKSLEITWLEICRFEKKVTDALEMQQQAEKENWNEGEHMDSRRKMALKRRYVMMGLATVGGGLVIGLSAGLLAPLIGSGLVAGFAAIGVGASSTTFLAGASGTAIIASSAAASGSFIGVRAANRRTGSVRTFEYRPLHNNKRVNLIITVSGWMTGKVDDVRLPFSTVESTMGDIYSVLWEPELLRSMGDTINILATEALTQGLQQVLASTFLTSLMAAITLPVVLTKLAYLIDNPWAVSQDRAWAAGLILADSLIDRNLGTRPITLVGYSLGARVIFSCLLELARKGAIGLIQNVYLFGAPVVVKQDEWLRIRTVVAGRLLSGYSKSDWILGYLFRLTNGGVRRVAGLAPIEGIPGIENMDVSEFVKGHMDYRAKMPRLLRECGWLVEADEFSEIEDPDPENHAGRQRELINEIEEARRELENEAKASKGGWLSFGRKKKALKRKDWEIYEDQGSNKQAANGEAAAPERTEDKDGNNHGVLFDVEAIRAELAKETSRGSDPVEEILQVRELPSTLPPMKLNTVNLTPSPSFVPAAPMSAASSFPKSPRDNLRAAHSAGATPTYRTSYEYRLSEERSPSSLKAPGHQYPAAGNGYRGASFGHKTPDRGSFGGGGGNDSDMDDGVQMTFDTSFEDTHHRHQPAPPPLYQAANTSGSRTLTASSPSNTITTTAMPAGANRPNISSSQSTPAVARPNPWDNYDDDDDAEFGKEKEISMTFA